MRLCGFRGLVSCRRHSFNARSARGSVMAVSISRVGRDGSGARHVAGRGCTGLRGCAGVHVALLTRSSCGRGHTSPGQDLDGLTELGMQLRIVVLEHFEKLLRGVCFVMKPVASLSNSFISSTHGFIAPARRWSPYRSIHFIHSLLRFLISGHNELITCPPMVSLSISASTMMSMNSRCFSSVL